MAALNQRFVKASLLLLSVTIVALACVLIASRSKEQRFRGRPISGWIKQDILDHSCTSNVLAALEEFPVETTQAFVQVIRDAIHETPFDRQWKVRISRWPRAIRKILLRSPTAEDSRGYVGHFVENGLTGNGPVSDAWMTTLLAVMKDPDPAMRSRARSILVAGIDPGARGGELDIRLWKEKGRITAAWVEACQDADDQVRWGAIRTIGRVRPLVEAAVPVLVKHCVGGDESMRRGASLALAEMKREPAVAVPILIEIGLNEIGSVARAGFLGAVRNYGPDAAFAAPQLEAGLKDKDEEVRATVAKALLLIRPAAVADK